jgi:hypothetical protein
MVEGVGPKQKWMVVSAAIIALAELPEPRRQELIHRAAMADAPGGSWDEALAAVNPSRMRGRDGATKRTRQTGVIPSTKAKE